jgi:ABC-2 type transport system ATP-binding protein
MQQPFLVFENISKSFGSKKVIKNLTLSIHHHEIFGIIGRSGAGKSTLLKLLIGFFHVDNGKIIFQTKNITNDATFIKQLVGFCTQENSFYPELTVVENLYYYGRLYGLSGKELRKREQELLGVVGLSHHKDVAAGNLSGGMKRRLDFAISLVHYPPLLILDEPTTGLDPITEKTIWELIKDLSKQGISIIIISHMLDYMEKYCDTVGFLADGQILLTASPSSLRKKYPHKDTFADIFQHILEESR